MCAGHGTDLAGGSPATGSYRQVYADKVACYTKVYLISNVPLEQQYPVIQAEQPKTWNALKRRIRNVYELLPDNTATPFD